MTHLITLGIFLFFISVICLSFCFLVLVTPNAFKAFRTLIISNITISSSVSQRSLTKLLSELSRCQDRDKLEHIVKEIRQKAEIILQNVSEKERRKANSVILWLDKFSIERHLKDLKSLRLASQIRYDNLKKDFRLIINSKSSHHKKI
ncbi:MAG: hypothetical protein ACRCTQ_01770 [Brevinemataceae bacterium]